MWRRASGSKLPRLSLCFLNRRQLLFSVNDFAQIILCHNGTAVNESYVPTPPTNTTATRRDIDSEGGNGAHDENASKKRAASDASPVSEDTSAVKEINAVRIRGIPFHTTEEMVRQFFAGLTIDENCIFVVQPVDGRPSGEAYVEFRSVEDAAAAR
jgi:RNA recognition motif-containing protein